MKALWIVLVGLAMLPSTGLGASDATDVTVTPIARDGQVQVSFDLSDGFTEDVRDAVRSGLPTTFTYTLELRRDAPVWFDTTLAEVTVSATARFDNLTRRYEMTRTVNGVVEHGGPTEDDGVVGRWMTHFERVPVSATSRLEANGEYYVRVRMQTHARNTWVVWPWDSSAALGNARFTFIP
jgi:hypothetical protein